MRGPRMFGFSTALRNATKLSHTILSLSHCTFVSEPFSSVGKSWRNKMDVPTLASTVTTYLAQYLPTLFEAGKCVGSKSLEKLAETATDDVWKIVKPWIGNLLSKIEGKPAALEAAHRVAKAPENTKYRTALEVQLEDILERDRRLAEEIEQILSNANSGDNFGAEIGGVTNRDNAHDNVTIIGGFKGDFVKGDKYQS